MRVVRVAAAADLKFAMDALTADFQRSHPEIQIRPTYGSSGNFYMQLTQQAPFDLYLSADMEYSQRLVEQGQGLEDSQFVYAVGRIVMWSHHDSSLDIAQRHLEALLDPKVRKLAIANPRHAPYGRAAEEALRHYGLYNQVSDQLAFGENVAQAAQFVQSGAADAGIIALSLAMSPMMQEAGKFWTIPAEAHRPLVQGGVILKWAEDRAAAEAFRDFLLSATGREILEQYGFEMLASEP